MNYPLTLNCELTQILIVNVDSSCFYVHFILADDLNVTSHFLIWQSLNFNHF